MMKKKNSQPTILSFMASRICYEFWASLLFSSISSRRWTEQPSQEVYQTSIGVDWCAKMNAFISLIALDEKNHVTKPNQYSLLILIPPTNDFPPKTLCFLPYYINIYSCLKYHKHHSTKWRRGFSLVQSFVFKISFICEKAVWHYLNISSIFSVGITFKPPQNWKKQTKQKQLLSWTLPPSMLVYSI